MLVDARVRLPVDLRDDTHDRPPELVEGYGAVLDVFDRDDAGRAELEAALDEYKVDIALVHAEFEFGEYADQMNLAVSDMVADEPRYRGVGTVSQQQSAHIMRTVAQVAECAQRGFLGVNIQPAFFHLGINDSRFYPVYAKAAELGLVVFVHTGINYGTTLPFGNDHPMLLDEIACAFPELDLVACHAGWPWTAEMVAVARKHRNVYLEFGGLSPKYIAAPGSGWEVMYRFMNSVLQDQILFGTDWPAFDIGRAVAEWQEMELKQAVREKLLGGNAARLFKL